MAVEMAIEMEPAAGFSSSGSEYEQQICVVRQREAVIRKVPRNLSSKSCGISALLFSRLNIRLKTTYDSTLIL